MAKWYESLNLSSEDRALLKRALGTQSDAEAAERLEQVSTLAVAEYVDWLTGARRFASVSEIDTYRFLHLYLDVRKEVPTVESLVNDSGLSVGRATSLMGRLRYGEARALQSMARQQAKAEIERQLDVVQEHSRRKTIWVGPDIQDVIMQVAASIMRHPEEHGKGGKWPSAEEPTMTRSRYESPISASTDMWKYILDGIATDGT